MAADHRCRRVRLDVIDVNPRARALCERHGRVAPRVVDPHAGALAPCAAFLPVAHVGLRRTRGPRPGRTYDGTAPPRRGPC
ncbi:hypothetical protein [Streptomyces sp. NPDC006971]|uniref:hypothetical protein n=1 Tax=Streptomyces sp. NPDC006971 TaxID=3154784 RepID=UPI0033D31E1E